ncbi:MAG TPA: glycoside hydrolase family 19 protein [Allosphingosinicella sp.]|nr:glycoside hydrolase family 19 protein [Allosphingosinicella sp.]
MNVLQLQARLAALGRDPGAQDDVLGPRTYAALFAAVAARDLGDVGIQLGAGAAAHFPAYAIDTPLRLSHFIAQAAHESEGFRFFREIWGPTPAQRRYEGSADLGNTKAGDGRRFCGRGIFQLTGRANYATAGAKIGLDLVNHPELAEDPATSVLIACLYWQTHGLNALADADDVVSVTRKINGGANGLADREAMLARAKAVLL